MGALGGQGAQQETVVIGAVQQDVDLRFDDAHRMNVLLLLLGSFVHVSDQLGNSLAQVVVYQPYIILHFVGKLH